MAGCCLVAPRPTTTTQSLYSNITTSPTHNSCIMFTSLKSHLAPSRSPIKHTASNSAARPSLEPDTNQRSRVDNLLRLVRSLFKHHTLPYTKLMFTKSYIPPSSLQNPLKHTASNSAARPSLEPAWVVPRNARYINMWLTDGSIWKCSHHTYLVKRFMSNIYIQLMGPMWVPKGRLALIYVGCPTRLGSTKKRPI
jgi:hypothetical protein